MNTKKQFRLSKKPAEKLELMLNEIKKGILNVCNLHTYDKAPSMTKAAFERAYIDKVLGATMSMLSLDIKTIVAALEQQRVKEEDK